MVQILGIQLGILMFLFLEFKGYIYSKSIYPIEFQEFAPHLRINQKIRSLFTDLITMLWFFVINIWLTNLSAADAESRELIVIEMYYRIIFRTCTYHFPICSWVYWCKFFGSTGILNSYHINNLTTDTVIKSSRRHDMLSILYFWLS